MNLTNICTFVIKFVFMICQLIDRVKISTGTTGKTGRRIAGFCHYPVNIRASARAGVCSRERECERVSADRQGRKLTGE